MPFRVRITKKKKKKRLQKEIMTGADKLIGGNSNITLYYFHGRANVVNLMWLAYVKSIRILLSRWPIKMYFTELLDRCKADIWRHAGCNFCKQEWYYLLRYGTRVKIMASKPTKTVRHQKFLTEYTAKWDFIVPSVKGETYARCNSCNSDFSIKSSGAYDIKIHIESAKHKSSAEARASNHAGVPCHKRELKRDLLQKCKKATVEYNKSMSQRNL